MRFERYGNTALAAKAWAWVDLIRLRSPTGFLLLLWPTLWALWLAAVGHPDIRTVAIMAMGAWVCRGLGCAINDLWDHHLDAQVARTRTRPLPSGRLHRGEALLGVAVLGLVACFLLWLLPPATWPWGLAGALLTITYPLTKRILALPQAYLGLAFGWGVPMAFVAVRGSMSMLGWLVFACAALWALIYDGFYAMADEADDRKAGVRSMAIFLGSHLTGVIAGCQMGMLVLLAAIGWEAGLAWSYFLALLLVAGLFMRQQDVVRRHGHGSGLRAFHMNQWVGAVVFLGVVGGYGGHGG